MQSVLSRGQPHLKVEPQNQFSECCKKRIPFGAQAKKKQQKCLQMFIPDKILRCKPGFDVPLKARAEKLTVLLLSRYVTA